MITVAYISEEIGRGPYPPPAGAPLAGPDRVR